MKAAIPVTESALLFQINFPIVSIVDPSSIVEPTANCCNSNLPCSIGDRSHKTRRKP